MKKGLIATVIIGLVLALSLGIYTIVETFTEKSYYPRNYEYSIAYRTGDTAVELEGYSLADGTLEFTLAEGVTLENAPIKFNTETNKYDVVSAGTMVATTHAENGDTTKYNITIFAQGTGASANDAYVICNAAHLREYAALVSEDATALSYYISLANDIDIAGENWKPIGDSNNPFTGTLNGNGYTILNMNITVDRENYTDYISRPKNPNNNIDLGFFGKTVNATIIDVNFKDAKILVKSEILPLITSYAFDSVVGLEGGVVGRIAIGTVAGYMTRTTYTSTVAETTVKVENTNIQGFSYNGQPSGVEPNGIGTVAGVISESKISNLDVTSKIYADYLINEGSRVGGVVGYINEFDKHSITDETTTAANKTTLDTITVKSTISTRYYLGDEAIAATNYSGDKYNTVGLIAAYARSADISNVTVSSSQILDNNGTWAKVPTGGLPSQEYLALMSGGVARAYSNTHSAYTGEPADYYTTLTNVVVDGVYANPAGIFGGVVGIAYENSQFVDCYAKVEAYGSSTGGFAYELNENTTVKYTSAFAKPVAVKANIRGVRVAAFAVFAKGTIQGYANANGATTVIESTINGYSTEISGYESQADLVVASGFVAYMYSTVEDYTATATNFTINTNIKNSVHMVGLASMLGSTVRESELADAVNNTRLDGFKVNMTALSHTNSAGYSTTKKVAGAVGTIYDGATVNNVNVTINLNNGVNENKSYGAAIFGGLVAQVIGEDAIITNNYVTGNALITEGNFWNRKLLGDNQPSHYIQVAGGLIGVIANEDYNKVMVQNLNISNNAVENFTMKVVGDYEYTGTTENSGIFFRVRGIGALVGNINNNKEDPEYTLDLTSNELTNVAVSASYDAFTFVNYAITEDPILQVLVGKNGNAVVGTLNEYVDNAPYAYVQLPAATGVTYTDLTA